MTLKDYLLSLYVPKERLDEWIIVQEWCEKGIIEPFAQESKGVAIPIIEIKTSGNAPRKTFQGYVHKWADTGKMGKKMGEISVSNDQYSRGYPLRFKYDTYRFLINKEK